MGDLLDILQYGNKKLIPKTNQNIFFKIYYIFSQI